MGPIVPVTRPEVTSTATPRASCNRGRLRSTLGYVSPEAYE